MKLNLGSGKRHKPGYVSIDINSEYVPNIVWDLNNGLPHEVHVGIEAIWMDNVLEHLINPTLLLEECFFYLKDGGVIEIILPNTQWFPFLFIGWFIDLHRFWHWWMTRSFKQGRGIHYTLWTPFTINLLLKTIGFTVIKQKGTHLSKQFYIKAVKHG